MNVVRSRVFFALAALAEMGVLVRQGWREHRGVLWIVAGSATHLGMWPDHQPTRRRFDRIAEVYLFRLGDH